MSKNIRVIENGKLKEVTVKTINKIKLDKIMNSMALEKLIRDKNANTDHDFNYK